MAVIKGPDGVPVFNELLNINEILAIKPSNKQGVATIYNYLRKTGMENPVARMEANQAHLAGFDIVPGTPGYDRALDALVNAGSGRTSTVAFARRVATRTETLAQVDGNPNVEMVRIADGPAPCPACLELEGTQGTFAWFEAEGLLPPAQCYGSSNCMCQMQKIN
jgi:hypothetical protein